jgi:hypothetical protein
MFQLHYKSEQQIVSPATCRLFLLLASIPGSEPGTKKGAAEGEQPCK